MDSSQQLTTNVGMLIYLYVDMSSRVCGLCGLYPRDTVLRIPHTTPLFFLPLRSYPLMRCELPLLLSEASTQLETSESNQCPSQYQLPACSSHCIACLTTRPSSKKSSSAFSSRSLSRARASHSLTLCCVPAPLALTLSLLCAPLSLHSSRISARALDP